MTETADPIARVAGLACWAGPVTPEPLTGGITNKNYTVRDRGQRFVVRIDYQGRRVALLDPRTAAPPEGAVGIPVFLERGEPFLLGSVFLAGRANPAKLKIDTGSLDFLGLNGSWVDQTHLVPDGHARVPAPGVAAGGATENWVTRIDSLVVGPFSIAGPTIFSGVILPGMTSRAVMPSSVISRTRVLGVQRLVTVRRSNLSMTSAESRTPRYVPSCSRKSSASERWLHACQLP